MGCTCRLFLRSIEGQMIGVKFATYVCQTSPTRSWLRVGILFAGLVVAFDLAVNDENWLKAPGSSASSS